MNLTDPYGPECPCCGLHHGRPLADGEHCSWCTRHDGT